CARQDSNYDVW
nr:immunoglobulin heavy chain junction region [Macaca mulatta]MOY30852.1 immunoglobulin heavy chain junction region [Macaca mulatta]